MAYFKYILSRIDWFLITLVAILLILSFINIANINGRSEALLIKQGYVVLIGFIALFATSAIDYRYFKSYSGPAVFVYSLTALFLMAVLFFAEVRGISAWINVFSTYSIQPSEFGKLAVVIILAKYFSSRHKEIYDWKHILVSGLYVALPAGLTFLQPDFGSMTVYLVIWIVILFSSGTKISHLLSLFGVGSLGFAMSWFFIFQPYQKSRIISFVNPYADSRGAGYNSIQSQMTLGSGQFIGAFGNSLLDSEGNKYKITVPEPFTDFAFAVFGHKLGFLGISFFVVVLFVIILRLINIARSANNNFIKLFIAGFIAIIFTHAIINMGMNLGLLPITGIPLSFLSYGGSHLTMLMIGLGIIQGYLVHA